MFLPKSLWALMVASLLLQIQVYGTYSSGPSLGQHDAVQRQLTSNALNFHRGDLEQVFHTSNRGRAYVAEIRSDGFSVSGACAEWSVHSSVLSISKGSKEQAFCLQGLGASATELNYRGDSFTVQYLHSAFGLRQNFIVHTQPSGSDVLRVNLELNTALDARLLSSKSIGYFNTTGQQILSYEDLRVWDATGKPLRSWMELSCTNGQYHLALLVDDSKAAYPITIDPVSITPDRVLVGNQGAGEFGISTASAGDLNGDGFSDIVVGAWKASNGQNLEGLAFVYYGSESGIGSSPDVTLELDQAGAEFGCSVSTAGDVNGDGYADLIIGARRWENSTSTYSEGGAFIYHGSASGIGTSYDQFVQSNTSSAFLGSNVSTAGDIDNDGFSDIIVGAYLGSFPTNQEGAAFIYRGSASGLTFKHRLEVNHGGAHFSRSVAAAGDINGDGYSDIVIGASQYDNVGLNDGIALVYYGGANGFGLGTPYNTPPDLTLAGSGIQSSAFGWSVSCAGDLNGDGYSDLAVGSYRDRNGQNDEGRVYVYHGSSVGLLPAPVAILESNQVGAWMGRSLSNVGDMNGDGYGDLAIGIPLYDQGQVDEGVVRLHFGSPSGISTTHDLLMQLNNAGGNFGNSVQSAGDVNGDGYSDMIVGAKLYGSTGAAGLFHGGAYNVEASPSTQMAGNASFDHLGESVAGAGDVNGDGFSDILVGAPDASDGQASEGLVYFYQAGITGFTASPQILQRNVVNGDFGQAVSSAGDVNGDGYVDVIIGAPGVGAGGVAYIYFGSPSGLPASPSRTLTGPIAGSQFGYSVAAAGDINSDGYAEVIVGAPNGNRAYLYSGSSTGTVSTPIETLSGTGNFGWCVSSAGDVNGDGFSDIAVSGPNQGNGIVRVYHGEVAGLITPHAVELSTTTAGAQFGYSISGAGDMDADGFFDLVIGAPYFSNGQVNEGALFVHFGSSAGLSTGNYDKAEGNVASGLKGFSVDEAGDVNGDGYADVIVGAPYLSNNAGQVNEGYAFIYEGSSAGVSGGLRRIVQLNTANMLFGSAVAGAGDIDGDGFSDVLVGAPNHSPTLAEQGSFNVMRGNDGNGLSRLTRQYQANLSSPLATNSMDFSDPNNFGIGHRAVNFTQRSDGRLHWEIAFEGAAWNGSPVTNGVVATDTSTVWTDLGVNGIEIKELIFKKPGQIRYKWRVRVEFELSKAIDGQRFSRWFYGFGSGHSDIGVLPVDILSFTGSSMDDHNLLNWTVASEQDLSHYIVERASNDLQMEAIGMVDAIGGGVTVNYSFRDQDPLPGMGFYQLRAVDVNGDQSLSSIVPLERKDLGTVTLFPNPTTSELTIRRHRNFAETIEISDSQGRVIHTVRTDLGLLFKLDVSTLSSGTYFLCAKRNEEVLYRGSFVKE